jgi:endonuclease YncB( thermonuclease family)
LTVCCRCSGFFRHTPVDAPEHGQPSPSASRPGGTLAEFAAATGELAFQRRGQDRYGRTLAVVTLAVVTLPNGRCLNQELVRADAAWWFPKYAGGDRELERLPGRGPGRPAAASGPARP